MAVAYLIVALLLVAVLDGFDVGERLGLDGNYPVWYQLFQEASMTEWLQSIALVGVVFFGGVAAERSRIHRDTAMAGLLTLLALSAAVLLLEDAGNVTQRMAEWLGQAFGEDSLLGRRGRVPLLALVAAVPLYAVWRHRGEVARMPAPSRRLLLLSLATYGFMALTGEVMQSYAVVGPSVDG